MLTYLAALCLVGCAVIYISGDNNDISTDEERGIIVDAEG